MAQEQEQTTAIQSYNDPMWSKYMQMIRAEIEKAFPTNWLGEKVDKQFMPDGSWNVSYRGEPVAFISPPAFDRVEWENGQVDISITVNILPLN